MPLIMVNLGLRWRLGSHLADLPRKGIPVVRFFTIAYDLKAPNDSGADYERVIGGIQRDFPSWAHTEKSVFCVRTSATIGVAQVRDQVQRYLNAGDKLLVFEATAWAWNGEVEPDVAAWLNSAA
jgi:hypothetical protein